MTTHCPHLYSTPTGKTMPCNLETVVTDRFVWNNRNCEERTCPAGHVTEWDAHPDEQG